MKKNPDLSGVPGKELLLELFARIERLEKIEVQMGQVVETYMGTGKAQEKPPVAAVASAPRTNYRHGHLRSNVWQVIRESTTALAFHEICEAVANSTGKPVAPASVTNALAALRKAHKIKRTGTRGSYRYQGAGKGRPSGR